MKRLAILLIAALFLSGCAFTATEPAPFMAIKGKSDGTYIPIAADNYTGGIQTVATDHAAIHDGVSYRHSSAETLGNGANVTAMIQTSSGPPYANMEWIIEGTQELSVKFYEGATVSDNGTLQAAYNANRNYADTPNTILYHGPTVTDYGTLIKTVTIGEGVQEGGNTRALDEWLLAPNTNYLLVIENATASNNNESHLISWYEH